LFFVELATRRVRLAGITTNPDGQWVTQQARKLLMQLDDEDAHPRLLVRDRNSKFTREFDEVFHSQGIRVIKAPVRAPKARAHAERWVGTVRRECLDRLLILGRRHLALVLREYTAHYNEHRPHRSLAQRPPLAPPTATDERPPADVIELDRIRRRDRSTSTNSPRNSTRPETGSCGHARAGPREAGRSCRGDGGRAALTAVSPTRP